MTENNAAMNTVLHKLNTSYTLWMVVGICQIVFGFWYVTPIFFGAWNIYCACGDGKELEGQRSPVHHPQRGFRRVDRRHRMCI